MRCFIQTGLLSNGESLLVILLSSAMKDALKNIVDYTFTDVDENLKFVRKPEVFTGASIKFPKFELPKKPNKDDDNDDDDSRRVNKSTKHLSGAERRLLPGCGVLESVECPNSWTKVGEFWDVVKDDLTDLDKKYIPSCGLAMLACHCRNAGMRMEDYMATQFAGNDKYQKELQSVAARFRSKIPNDDCYDLWSVKRFTSREFIAQRFVWIKRMSDLWKEGFGEVFDSSEGSRRDIKNPEQIKKKVIQELNSLTTDINEKGFFEYILDRHRKAYLKTVAFKIARTPRSAIEWKIWKTVTKEWLRDQISPRLFAYEGSRFYKNFSTFKNDPDSKTPKVSEDISTMYKLTYVLNFGPEEFAWLTDTLIRMDSDFGLENFKILFNRVHHRSRPTVSSSSTRYSRSIRGPGIVELPQISHMVLHMEDKVHAMVPREFFTIDEASGRSPNKSENPRLGWSTLAHLAFLKVDVNAKSIETFCQSIKPTRIFADLLAARAAETKNNLSHNNSADSSYKSRIRNSNLHLNYADKNSLGWPYAHWQVAGFSFYHPPGFVDKKNSGSQSLFK